MASPVLPSVFQMSEEFENVEEGLSKVDNREGSGCSNHTLRWRLRLTKTADIEFTFYEEVWLTLKPFLR
jgi:hypothetical protein